MLPLLLPAIGLGDGEAVVASYTFRGDTLKDEWGIGEEEDDGVGIDGGGV